MWFASRVEPSGRWLWGFIENLHRPPEVTVVGAGTRLVDGVRVHRTSRLDPEDHTRLNRIPVTTPARTLLDLAAVVEVDELRAAVRRAQSRRRVTVRELVAILGRLGPRRGSRALASVIATGPAPTRSELEDVVLDLLLDAGVAHPDVNKPLVLDGRRVVPDFRWPDQRLVVEADGAAWHENPIAREEDAARQAILEAHGERVIRVTWEQAVCRGAETVARIRAAGAPRK